MERRRFARTAILSAVPLLAGCARNGTDRSTAPVQTTTATGEEPTTYTLQYRLSGEHVSKAPAGVTPSPYPAPEYENQYITELVSQAIDVPTGETVVVEVPREDHQTVKEAYPKLNGDGKGVFVEYEGEVVRVLFYILE